MAAGAELEGWEAECSRLKAECAELMEALKELSDAARSACDARQHPSLVEALSVADRLVILHEGRQP